MCTVTLLRISSNEEDATGDRDRAAVTAPLLRVSCNRDESRRRAPARPPEIRRFGECRAIFPVDPISDGTWIAVNDAGLVMTLMNIYPGNRRELSGKQEGPPPLSRGTIIPKLMRHSRASTACDEACRLDAHRFSAFCLLIIDEKSVSSIRSDGGVIRAENFPVTDEPQMFTSSGLGDELVDPPRRALFHEFVARSDDPIQEQDQFHRHSWPDRPHLSVCMRRDNALTVSNTVVEIRPADVKLIYHPAAPDEPAENITVTLNRV
jgi:hypothetical protein